MLAKPTCTFSRPDTPPPATFTLVLSQGAALELAGLLYSHDENTGIYDPLTDALEDAGLEDYVHAPEFAAGENARRY